MKTLKKNKINYWSNKFTLELEVCLMTVFAEDNGNYSGWQTSCSGANCRRFAPLVQHLYNVCMAQYYTCQMKAQ